MHILLLLFIHMKKGEGLKTAEDAERIPGKERKKNADRLLRR